MKNLKRVLSLALSGIMLVGMMAVGASAVDAKDFTDADEIQNKEAVETLVALNVISGKDTGAFDPKGSLTRAEMAKLAVFVLHGGKDPVLGTKATPTFSDIKSNWAESYIEYCASTGIINGQGDGTFAPNGTLTGSQAAKMILTAMGYNADVFHFTGADWEINTNVEANKAKLYDGLEGMDPTKPITRDEAAQLIYNAIKAPLMVRSWSQDQATGAVTEMYNLSLNVDGSINKTLLKDKFGGTIEKGYLSSYNYDNAKKQWTYNFTTSNPFGGPNLSSEPDKLQRLSLKSKTDYTGFYGQQVKVVYKSNTNDVVYGIYANDSAVLEEGFVGSIGRPDTANRTVKINGNAYKANFDLNSTANVFKQNAGSNGQSLTDLATSTDSWSFKAIDNNTDGEIDCIVVTPLYVGKITYVGADTITVNSPVSEVTGATPVIDDIEIYEGFAKNDWVVVTPAANSATRRPTFAKAEVQEGSIDGIRENASQFRVDGSWFEKGNNNNVASTTLKINDTIEYIAVGDYFFYAKVKEAATTSKELCMIVSVGEDNNLSDINSASLKVKLLFSDGTTKTAGLASIDGDDTKANLWTSATTGTASTAVGNQLFTYKTDSDGNYVLTSVAAASQTSGNLAGYKGTGTVAGYNGGKVGGKELADDAKVFVFIGTVGKADAGNKGKVLSGKELKNEFGAASSITGAGTVTGAACLYDMVDGFTYAKVGLIANGNEDNLKISKGSNYGYLVGNAFHTYEGDKTYTNYKFWDGENTVEAREATERDLDEFKSGVIITYDNKAEGEIKNVAVVAAKMGIVTGWDKVKKMQIAGETEAPEVTSDTTIIVVDSKNKKGVEANGIDAIQIGEDRRNNDDIADVPNIRYVLNSDSKKVVLLVIDSANEMQAAPARVLTGNSVTAADIEAELANASSVTVKGTVADLNGLDIPAKKTVTITTVTDITTGNVTVAEGSTLNIGTLTAATTDITGSGTVVVGTLTAGAGSLKTATVKVTGASTKALLEAIPVVAGKTLIVGAESTDNGSASTWYTAAGDESNAGTAKGATDKIAAGTYVASTVYTDGAGTTATKWLLK